MSETMLIPLMLDNTRFTHWANDKRPALPAGWRLDLKPLSVEAQLRRVIRKGEA